MLLVTIGVIKRQYLILKHFYSLILCIHFHILFIFFCYQDAGALTSLIILVVQVHGQGTRCQTKADCTGKIDVIKGL
jgi:hypothetical protein